MDTLISNNQPAPDFTLHDLAGSAHSLGSLRGKIAIINFWSAECPHAARTDQILLTYLQKWGKKVELLSIASNANETVEQIQRAATERGLPLVLLDPQQQVANLYGAITTPHLFVVDTEGTLRYQGALDDVTFRQRQPTRFYLRQAVDAVLARREPDPDLTQAYGCAVVRYAL